MQLSKEEYAIKRIHNGCSVRIENSVNQDICSASLGYLTAIKDSYNKDTCKICVMFEHLLHMNMRYVLSVLILHTKT